MKEWFKYENGFVNIDDENLYLTNTGNWSEIKSIKEKSKSSIAENSRRKLWNGSFLYGFIGIAIFIMFAGLIAGELRIGLIVILGLGSYFLYKYMKRDLGSKYLIPVTKIQKIEIEDSNVKIIFRNAVDEIEQEELPLVEAKGLIILKELKA